MNKKQRKQLSAEVDAGADVVYVNQQRPVTIVHLRYGYEGRDYNGLGYSKVCWPDRWNSKMGWRVARGKAVAQIVKQIMRDTQ